LSYTRIPAAIKAGGAGKHKASWHDCAAELSVAGVRHMVLRMA
jgi:hypothetical protein